MAAVTALAAVGLWERTRRRITIFEVFPVFYVVVLLIWPANQGLRFLLPLLPLLLFYALYGLDRSSQLPENVSGAAIVALTLALGASYLGAYGNTDDAELTTGIHEVEAQQLFAFVRENTEDDDVVVFRKPRALSLFTGRRSSVYHEVADDIELWRYFSLINASYVATASWDDIYFKRFLERNEPRFATVFSNAGYSLLRITNPAREPGSR